MFVPTMHTANAHGAFHDPARRWQRSDYLVRHRQRPFRTLDDADTEAACQFRRALDHCRTDVDRDKLNRRYPAMAAAHHYYTTAPPMARAELEARLLAGQSDDDIAAKMNMSPAGVAAYHNVFFEVRPHLQADTHIMNVVLGAKVHNGLDRDDHALLLKAIGYGMGGAGVDQYLDMINDPPVMPASLDLMDLPSLKKLRDKTAFKLGLLLMTTPAAATSPASWLWLRERLAAQRRGAVESAQSPRLAIRPALEAPAFVIQAHAGHAVEDRQDHREQHQVVVRRQVRPELAAKQDMRVAVPA